MVVNVKLESCDVYVGRTCAGFVDEGWGNPFKVGVMGSRDECIKKYKTWLWERIKANRAEMIKKLSALSGKKLGCWCKPLPCHAEVLEAAVQWAVAQEKANGTCV